MDDSWAIGQDSVQITQQVGPFEVFRQPLIVGTIQEGPLKGWVPLCRSNFVDQPLLINFTVNSLDEFVLETVLDLPVVMGELETDAEVVATIFTTTMSFSSSASISVKLIARVTATDIRLQK